MHIKQRIRRMDVPPIFLGLATILVLGFILTPIWITIVVSFNAGNHAYPVTAQFAISLRGPRLRGRTGLCTISHRSVTLSGRQFSVHYQKPLMARNDD